MVALDADAVTSVPVGHAFGRPLGVMMWAPEGSLYGLMDVSEEGEMGRLGAVVVVAASVSEEALVGHAFGSPLGVTICAPDGSL